MAAVSDMEPKTSQNPLPSSSPNEKTELISQTMGEIDLRGGRSVGSMNMDEFLANLWTNEENTVAKDEAGDELTHKTTAREEVHDHVTSCPQSQKVDEVWMEITKGIAMQDDTRMEPKTECLSPQLQQQPTLGEITLEDFLVKAGVIHEVSSGDPSVLIGKIEASGEELKDDDVYPDDVSLGCHVGDFGEPPIGNTAEPVGYNRMMDLGRRHNKRRMFDGQSEIVGERRQRRMIKNRESAARSRARKQAYTVELEHELNHLQEENAKLSRLVAENEKRRKEQLLSKQPSRPSQLRSSKMNILRRSVSVNW